MPASAPSSALTRVGRYWPELLTLALGVALRAMQFSKFDVRQGYDYLWHWPVVSWFADHPWEMPPRALSPEIYHPPLFYWLAGVLLRAGVYGLGHGNLVSLACSFLRLGVLAWVLPRFVEDRAARVLALALAALLPVAVHADLVASNEGLSILLVAVSMALCARFISAATERRWWLAVPLGLVSGLAIMTKLSGLVLVGAAAVTAACELAWQRLGWAARARRLAPWCAVVVVVAVVSGWFFVRNLRLYGKPILNSAEAGQVWYRDAVAEFNRVPYFQRRRLRYFVCWNPDIIAVTPYRPVSVTEKPCFFSALVASSTADVYFFGFLSERTKPLLRSSRDLDSELLAVSRASALGGTLIALATTGAWLGVFAAAWRRRQLGRLILLFVPLLAVLGQMHYAMQYPNEVGPVKGLYMQFAAPPLFALYGVACSWLWRRRATRPAALVCVAALGLVAAYTIYCRVL
jgi:4-amino-4-deoxy-L-arabinose transferase-like glycosyltransferase